MYTEDSPGRVFNGLQKEKRFCLGWKECLRSWAPGLIRLLCLAALDFLVVFPAEAAQIETLFMPGKVIQGHAKYEAECTNCHVRLRKNLRQKQLCLDCHKKIHHDMDAKKGHHGKNAVILNSDCISCHTDHKGRDARIAAFNKDVFDHKLTDYPLTGAHLTVECNNCHKPKTLYRDTASACYSCHRKDDAHKGELGKKCQQCHNTQSWPKAKFDHEKTKFPLRGKHRQVTCESCHPGARFKNTPRTCLSCHSVDDAHAGQNGKKCQTCHVPRKWKQIAFDHDRHTKFKLVGKHRSVKCSGCHRGPLYKEKTDQKCISCHRQDDKHLGRNGNKCESCHSPKKWSSSSFDHNRKTKFPLHGKHAKISCELCHKTDVKKKKPSRSCFACHQADDQHQGQLGKKCERCHQDLGWEKRIIFDHDLTVFPLLGQHVSTPCEQCHLNRAYKDASVDCFACHRKDDSHRGGLGKNCSMCHNPNDWRLWKFNHDTQTKFKLDGKHKGLACNACHKSSTLGRIVQSTVCYSCHLADDIHHEQYGTRCELCHNTKSFKGAELPR